MSPIGFFTVPTVVREEPLSIAPQCGKCGLHKQCKSPRMPYTGKGGRKILVVAETPGEEEDRQNIQLIGDAGQKLRGILAKFGVDLDKDCWKYNSVCCCAHGNPTDTQMDACRPNMLKVIRETEPEIVILLGAVAVKSVIGMLWRREGGVGKIDRWVGWKIPCRKWNTWICPTYHPSYLLRSRDPVLELWFTQHIEVALKLEGRPWPDGPPNYASQVELVFEPEIAAKIIRQMHRRGGPVALDYETDRLKPDSERARIVCCSICWQGKRTIAFPWVGEAIVAMGELLADGEVRKVGWNIKYEDRWSRKEFGGRVKGWEWDGMLATHILDNRPDICSLKFQAFTRHGLEPYDGAVHPYLKAKGGNSPNRVREVDLSQLLTYCGIDSLVTYMIYEQQVPEIIGNE